MSQVVYPYGPTSSLTNQSKYFTCFLQEGKIMAWDTEGTQQVGFSNGTYNELKKQYDSVYATASEYYARLTEEGTCPSCGHKIPAVITPELTQEQIVQQQAEQMRMMQEMIVISQKTQQELLTKIEALTASIPTIEKTGVSENVQPVVVDKPGKDTGNGSGKDKKSTTTGYRPAES